MQTIIEIANQFATAAAPHDPRTFGSGLINDTYLVRTPGATAYILQHINRRVFTNPVQLMHNLREVTSHVNAQEGRIRLPELIAAKDGRDYVQDETGEYWRMQLYLSGTRSFNTVQNPAQAQQAGYVLGTFQKLLSDLDINRLHDTLPGFHVTPEYLRQYEAVTGDPGADEAARYCRAFIAQRRVFAAVLENAKPGLRIRTIHGDPKLNNMLFDERDGRAVSIVDLDTVKPGLIHYDLGDCLRSCCNVRGEHAEAGDAVEFDLPIARAILQGYLPVVRDFIDDLDYAYFYDAIRLIPFELGIRFFTDYLRGNVYFKVQTPRQNLQRAIIQFRLTEDIENKERALRAMLEQALGKV